MTRVPYPRRELDGVRADERIALDLGTVSWPAPSAPASTAVTTGPEPPLLCRLHLWHHYRLVHDPGVEAHAACRDCGRLAPPTLFDPVVPTH